MTAAHHYQQTESVLAQGAREREKKKTSGKQRQKCFLKCKQQERGYVSRKEQHRAKEQSSTHPSERPNKCGRDGHKKREEEAGGARKTITQ